MSRRRTYEGEGIEVSYDASRCIHAAECANGLPSVFDPDRRPWVDPNGASADEVAAVIHRCPTGALAYRRLDGGAEEGAPSAASVRVVDDGPLYCTGMLRVQVVGQDEPLDETRVALCRCGRSSHKPFCDNAHADAGFAASGPLGTTSRAPSAESAVGPVLISPRANGPLVFDGDVEVSRPGESERLPLSRPAFCRCGHSSNKPFCDGTHRSAGFTAEGF